MNILYCSLLQLPSGGAGRTVLDREWLHLEPMIYQLDVHRKQVSDGYIKTVLKWLFCIFFNFLLAWLFLKHMNAPKVGGLHSLDSFLFIKVFIVT